MSDLFFFGSLGQPAEYTDHELRGLPNELKGMLKTIGILEQFNAADWYCISCQEWHEYIRTPKDKEFIQHCPLDLVGSGHRVSESDRIRWRVNWPNLRHAICLANTLAVADSLNIPNVYPIGQSTDTLVVLANPTKQESLVSLAQSLQRMYPECRVIVLTVSKLLVTHQDRQMLAGSGIHALPLRDAIENQWLIPGVQAETEPDYRITLNVNALTVTLDGESYAFKTSEVYLFKALRILLQANGSIVSKLKFEELYHTLAGNNSRTNGVNTNTLSMYKSELCTLLKKELKTYPKLGELFDTVRGEGYKLKPAFCPVKIIG